MSTDQRRVPRELLTMGLIVVTTVAFAGLMRGLRDRPADQFELGIPAHGTRSHDTSMPDLLPATAYAEMRRRETGPTSQWQQTIQPIQSVFNFDNCVTCHDPHTLDIAPSPELKRASLKKRAERRAYNGAPPIVPHSVEGTNDAACALCHALGARVGELVANRMPHPMLTDCLQCHAPPAPPSFQPFEEGIENLFAGFPTPFAGPRAYPDAPPLIPHSTWMRQNCLSCHGGIGGWPGLEVTHRWRTNCLQCHGTSAELEQGIVDPTAWENPIGLP